ncbi:MAG: beta-ketoacyl synthase N-terminal-like domain-containing protein [Planctomycetota bacterium]
MTDRTDVFITGLGMLTPVGIGREPFWQAVLNGQSGIRPIDQRTDGHAILDESTSLPGISVGGLVQGFDAKQYVRPRKALKVMCREIQMVYASTQLAIDDADLTSRLPAVVEQDGETVFRPSQVGTVYGSEVFYGPPSEVRDALEECIDESGVIDTNRFGSAAMKHIMPLWMLKYLPNMPACHVGISVNAHGPNNSLVLGEVSGPAALAESINCLHRGHASLMLTGAVGTRVNTTRLYHRADYPVAELSDPLEHSSKPHDRASSGVVNGEAAIAMTLQTRKDISNPKLALAKVMACTSRFHADPQQAIGLSIRGAFETAGISPDEVGCVVSAATGDRESDTWEGEALLSVFNTVPPVVTPNALMGLCGSASGSIMIAVAVEIIDRQVIPPAGHPGMQMADSAVPLSLSAGTLESPYVLATSFTRQGVAVATIVGPTFAL